MPRVLTDEARAILDTIPGWMQNAPEYKALALVAANESARMRAKVAEVRDGLIPMRTNALLLPLWEYLLGLTIEPEGMTVEARRTRVIGRLRQAPPDPSGKTWEARITDFIGPGWTYEEVEGPGEEERQRIIVYVPFALGTPNFEFAKRIVERERPAAWEITVIPLAIFTLDVSKLDVTEFGA